MQNETSAFLFTGVKNKFGDFKIYKSKNKEDFHFEILYSSPSDCIVIFVTGILATVVQRNEVSRDTLYIYNQKLLVTVFTMCDRRSPTCSTLITRKG